MLNVLDRDLEARGVHFVSYADECVKAVGSSAGTNTVMSTTTKWIERKLGLKVYAEKTIVTKPTRIKYLGFGLVKMGGKWKARPHQDSVKKNSQVSMATIRHWIGPRAFTTYHKKSTQSEN